MGELITIETEFDRSPHYVGIAHLDLTEQARVAGIPVPVRITRSVYDMVINVTPPWASEELVKQRKLGLIQGLVKMMCRRGLRMNGHLGFSALMPDQPNVDYCRLVASLYADVHGNQCISIGRPSEVN